jgi:hypothetical protein
MNKIIILLLMSFSLSAQEQKMLELHNDARADVGSPNLVISKSLSTYAQKIADSMSRISIYNYRLPLNKNNIGTNIFISDRHKDIWDAFIFWYSEIDDYKYGRFVSKEINPPTCHYTQMVWNNTKQLGVGISNLKNGGVVIVCTYYPSGNIINQYPY